MAYSPDAMSHGFRAFVTAFRQFRAAPNLLTMLRLFVLPFLVITILNGHWRLAFALLWVAGVSDGLDGLLARVLEQKTKLGQYLDPIADKMLLSTMFLVLTHVGVIPRFVTVLVLSRDIGILLIATLLFATNTLRDFRPSKLGKLNTLVQILGVLTVMTCQVIPRSGLEDLRTVLLWSIAVLAPVSGGGVCVDRDSAGERAGGSDGGAVVRFGAIFNSCAQPSMELSGHELHTCRTCRLP